MSISFVILLTSFPPSTLAQHCPEILKLCRETISKKDRTTWQKCCDRVAVAGSCMCSYLKNPQQKEGAFRLMASCGKGIPQDIPPEKFFKCG